MKLILILLIISSYSYSVCLTAETAKVYGCQRIDTTSAANWCSDEYSSNHLAYKTTDICNRMIQERFKYGYYEKNIMSVETSWNDKFKKMVSFKCKGYFDYMCEYICQDKVSCLLQEGTCKDCAGTKIDIVNLFKNVGKTITRGKEVTGTLLADIINKGEFVTFSSKSIYNIVTSYNAKSVQRRFKSLCSDGTEYPVIFSQVYPKTRELRDVSYVVCKKGIFELSTMAY